MAKITREELLKFAELSSLKVSSEELLTLVDDLQELFDYVQQLDTFNLEKTETLAVHNVNLFRDDVVQAVPAPELLAQSPEHTADYFVVPKIVDAHREENA